VIDTFQRLDYSITPDEARQRAEAFKADYAGSVKSTMKMLFHADADSALIAEAEKRMLKTSPVAAHAMFMSLAGYDSGNDRCAQLLGGSENVRFSERT
jgi:hypothetical protein